MFCKTPSFASFSIGSNAVVCAEGSTITMAARAFKSLASTNFAMPARLASARLFALASTNVLQIFRRVLQTTAVIKNKSGAFEIIEDGALSARPFAVSSGLGVQA